MRASAIRYLSTRRFSHRLAAAFWEKTVQIWDLDLREQVSQFDTGMTDSSNQLHLDPNGERGVAAAWSAVPRVGLLAVKFRPGS
ncbi:MAG: hypothetical protein DMG76_22510 [Acidobacteria bacterium]|nr:MAG: hypothetical protein DMG76_22510 [Acidobacteriota bacterium]